MFSRECKHRTVQQREAFDSLPSFSSRPCDEQVADRQQTVVERKNERLFRLTLIRIEQN